MHITQKIEILFRLGEILNSLAERKEWEGYDLGINQEEYNELKNLTKTVHHHNGWFKEEMVLKSFKGISDWLKKEQLEKFIKQNPPTAKKQKTIALIMAGNIPLVGFHDVLCVFLSGNKALIKLSSDDALLLPALLHILSLFDENVKNEIVIAENKLENFDAIIATGSDNSATHFKSYFEKYPKIIRRNRTSVAILDGSESKEDLMKLGSDIFDYYGLGCRNVTKIFIPKDYNKNTFFEAIFDYNDVINHNKYANNYDYNKAVYLMNLLPILDNNFLMLKEDEGIHSPIGVLFYEYYSDINTLKQKLDGLHEDLQVIIGKNYTPFGHAQRPNIDDFADGVNTMEFLAKL